MGGNGRLFLRRNVQAFPHAVWERGETVNLEQRLVESDELIDRYDYFLGRQMSITASLCRHWATRRDSVWGSCHQWSAGLYRRSDLQQIMYGEPAFVSIAMSKLCLSSGVNNCRGGRFVTILVRTLRTAQGASSHGGGRGTRPA
jgi:hypothetical protein